MLKYTSLTAHIVIIHAHVKGSVVVKEQLPSMNTALPPGPGGGVL